MDAGRPALCRANPVPTGSDLTVVEVCNAYRKHANAYYVKNGKTTREAYIIQEMIRLVVPLSGRKLATEFGPIALKTVRQQMMDAGLCRSHINKQTLHRSVRFKNYSAMPDQRVG
jgi:hypothetical protein